MVDDKPSTRNLKLSIGAVRADHQKHTPYFAQTPVKKPLTAHAEPIKLDRVTYPKSLGFLAPNPEHLGFGVLKP